ncbi:glycine-rich domain-containing protein 1-like isoform X1 [Salvia splendens]|uniref:glycine-rich domain-containing protein 1-like isoform X1 n=1 Tax=Salvia splendens TaxID=180675 RepID=UPI001C255B8A|nr:glycine-rich domain-containing protein 1-like isoform X1 [Salvia splendens]
MSASEGAASMRTLSEISEGETVHFTVDLVAAARRNIALFRSVSDSPWHNHKPTILEAVRRYDEIWMPLIADLTTGSKPPMLLPPLDVEWVWFCHTLNWANYRDYCHSRFSKLIGKPNIFDEENEDYALERCRKIWEHKFHSEPFENEADGDDNVENYSSSISEDLLDQVSRCSSLCRMYAEPYHSEMVYLVAARQRYRGFIYMVHRFGDECSCIVPTSDVYLMWLTHQSYPTVYAVDFKELEGDVWKIVGVGDAMKEEDMEETKMLWEKTFDQPYEKAGGAAITRPIVEPPFYWDVTNTDVNTKYKSLVPRFLFEVCIAVKLISNTKQVKRNPSRDFLRLRTAKCHRELKMDKPISHFMPETWQKAWHLYCEFGTKGLILDLRHHGGFCSRGSTLLDSKLFSWNDLLRAPSLASEKGIDDRARVVTSITPPVQAPYFLKCVPDRVTDDSGAMISDVILKMNQYRPQEGRWLSRTVLDHGGRECFVIRMRVGGGFYRRGGEAPKAVKWEDRIIQIFEGSWSYVIGSGSIGRSPEKLVGTATPKAPKEELQASWKLSSGIELVIQWDSSKSVSGLRFDLQSETSSEPMVKLLQGRHMQYEVKKSGQETQEEAKADTKNEQMEQDVRSEEGEYVTVVRYSEEIPSGKATALLNWKLLVVEVQPEEDAVLVLLLGMAILRSISEMKREDVGRLLVRRRIGEAEVGERDWGSVMLHPSSCSPLVSCSKLQPWYWNAKVNMASQARDHQGVAPASSNYSQAEGGDNLYRSGIIP